jgi:deoxyribodipyrimidine photo-lyase
MSVSVVWFRRDLRLADNPALAAAAGAEEILPVFCFEAALTDGRHSSANRNAYLLASLRELDDRLRSAGAPLHLRRGDPATEIPLIASECGAAEVHVNGDHTAHAVARDRRVAAALVEVGATLVSHEGIACADPATIRTAADRPFRVFTPFWRAWLDAPRRERAPRPRKLVAPAGIAVGRAPSKVDLGIDAAAERIAASAGPGERRGRALMRQAIAGAGAYLEVRDEPGLNATTRLSPPLHFGTISALELERELARKRSEGAGALRRQLAWRDFWLNIIVSNPSNRAGEHDPRFRGMRWREDPESLDAWKRGETGVPWIDAGMRQLLAEGWMHNRLRMAVASYLTKNLLIDWREGETHFMRHLLDGDEAQNNGNWQWAASVGADAQPWFRIFNPVRQQQRFDPAGSYVRRWVPELRDFPERHLTAPWEAPDDVQKQAGCVIGRDYPAPLVDLGRSREEAIARFRDRTR